MRAKVYALGEESHIEVYHPKGHTRDSFLNFHPQIGQPSDDLEPNGPFPPHSVSIKSPNSIKITADDLDLELGQLQDIQDRGKDRKISSVALHAPQVRLNSDLRHIKSTLNLFRKQEEVITDYAHPIKRNIDFSFAVECHILYFVCCFIMQLMELWMYGIISVYSEPATHIRYQRTVSGAYVFTAITASVKAIPWIQWTIFALRHAIRVRRYTGIAVASMELLLIYSFFYAIISSTMAQSNVASIAANTCGILVISQAGDTVYPLLGFAAKFNVGSEEVKDGHATFKPVDLTKDKGLQLIYRFIFFVLVVMIALTLNFLRYTYHQDYHEMAKSIPRKTDYYYYADLSDSPNIAPTSSIVPSYLLEAF